MAVRRVVWMVVSWVAEKADEMADWLDRLWVVDWGQLWAVYWVVRWVVEKVLKLAAYLARLKVGMLAAQLVRY